MIELNYPYTEADALRSALLMSQRLPGMRRLRWIPLVLGTALLAAHLVSYLGVPAPRSFASPLPILAVILIGIGLWVHFGLERIMRRAIVTNFKKNPQAGKTIHWTIDAATLATRTESSSVSLAWSALIEIQESNDGLLLFTQPQLAHWIPVHAFRGPSDLEEFRDLARINKVKLTRVS